MEIKNAKKKQKFYHLQPFISLQCKYTTKSDVWSFGVCLWEILQLASVRPFAEHSDEEILASLRSMQQTAENGNDDDEEARWKLLERPQLCSKEVYELMLECWQRDPNDRPSFREIHLFLQRKNLGYAPL